MKTQIEEALVFLKNWEIQQESTCHKFNKKRNNRSPAKFKKKKLC